jgi:CheY-like chemotaxis protein
MVSPILWPALLNSYKLFPLLVAKLYQIFLLFPEELFVMKMLYFYAVLSRCGSKDCTIISWYLDISYQLEKMTSLNHKKRILVVDDHPQVLKIIEIDLKLRGFEVLRAESGKKALEVIGSSKPDIMLLDMLMPDMSGFEVLTELRGYSKMPVIAFSASPENQEPAIHAGANRFVNKPFDPDDMEKIILSLLDHG